MRDFERIPLHDHADRNSGGVLDPMAVNRHVDVPTQTPSATHGQLPDVTSDQHHAQIHATAHQPGGSDTMAVDAAQGTGSLRTITTSTPQAIGTAAAGSGTNAASSNHVHATGAGTPSTQAFGDSAATGSGPAAAMTDHKHAMPAAAIASSGHTMTSARLLGRTTASTGAIEEITVGSGLSLSAGSLTATGGSSAPIANGTSNPGSPSTNDLFFRTDKGLLIYYDGTDWVTLTLYERDMNMVAEAVFANYSGAGAVRTFFPTNPDYTEKWVKWMANTYVVTTNSGTKFWSCALSVNVGTVSGTVSGTLDTSADTHDVFTSHTQTLGGKVAANGSAQINVTKTSTPGGFYLVGALLSYRLVVP